MPQCPTCGAQVDENQDICAECGTDLRSAVPVTSQRQGEQEALEEIPVQQLPSEQQPSQEQQQPAQATQTPAPIPSQVMTAVGLATLTLRRGGAATSEMFSLGERALIGRFDPETGPVDVDLGPLPESIYISRQHAEIYKNPTGQWIIRDLGSANGTFIRSVETGKFERVQGEREIDEGEEIALGNARFTFNAK